MPEHLARRNRRSATCSRSRVLSAQGAFRSGERLELCPRHGTVFARSRTGRPYCSKCQAEAGVHYRRRHPLRLLTEAQRLRRNERSRLRRLTPEGGAKLGAYESPADSAGPRVARRPELPCAAAALGTPEPGSRIMVCHNAVTHSKTPVPHSCPPFPDGINRTHITDQ